MMVPVTGHGSVGRVLCAMGDGVTSTEAADVDHISYSYFHKKKLILISWERNESCERGNVSLDRDSY